MPRWVKDAHTGQAVFEDEKGLIHLKDLDGSIKAVAPAEASKMLRDPVLGFAPATAEDLNSEIAKKQEEADSAKSSVLGAAARHVAIGAASGVLAPGKLVTGLGSAVLGTEDPLANISGRQVVQDLSAIGSHITGGESEVAARESREQILADEAIHPVASTVGEIGGNIIGSAPIGGGLGAIAGRGAIAAGLKGGAAKLAAATASSVVEGAGLGASQAAESAWINNSPLTAEQTLAGVGLGALFGGGTTLGLSAAGKVVPSIAKALGKGAPQVADGLEAQAAKLESSGVLAAERVASAPVDTVPESLVQRGRKWLSGMSDEARVEAIARDNKPAMKKLGMEPTPTKEEIRDAGKVLHEMGVTGTSDEKMFQQVTAGKERAGTGIGTILDDLDATAGAEAAPRVENVLKDVRAQVSELRRTAIVGKQRTIADSLERELLPTTERFEARAAWSKEAKVTVKDAYSILQSIEKSPSEGIRNYAATLRAGIDDAAKALEGGYADATHLTPVSQMVERLAAAPSSKVRDAATALVARIDDVASKADAAPRMGFRDLHTLRRAVDDVAYDSPIESKAMREQLEHVRGVIEKEITRAIEAKDPELLREYALNKRRYEVGSWAEKALGERLNVRNRSNSPFGLRDLVAGAEIAHAAGGPIGLAAALGSKVLRERGMSTFATLARKAAGEAVNVGAAPVQAAGVARNVQTLLAHAEERLNSGVGRFLGTGDAPVRGLAKRAGIAAALSSGNMDEARSAYRDHVRQVQAAASMPDNAAARLGDITGQALPTVAPGLHADMVQVASRAASYLASKAPAAATDPDSITPHIDTPPPVSHADLVHYADRVEGVEDPLSLLDDLNSGKVSPEKVEAIRAVWPQVFERIRQTVFMNLAQRTEPVPHSERVLLDMALDARGAIEPSLKPSSLRVMRAVFKSVQQAQPRQRGPMPELSKMFETRSSRIAMR